ncbi:hypothetical protein HDU93_005791, partial [Gonapodya sp. JEL0774]
MKQIRLPIAFGALRKSGTFDDTYGSKLRTKTFHLFDSRTKGRVQPRHVKISGLESQAKTRTVDRVVQTLGQVTPCVVSLEFAYGYG